MSGLTTEARPRLTGNDARIGRALLQVLESRAVGIEVQAEALTVMAAQLRQLDAGEAEGSRVALDALEAVELYGHGLDYLALHSRRLQDALRALLEEAHDGA